MENKRGAEMTIGTIIIIILALIVLVFLIVGFSNGWSNLWTSITNFGGGKANIDKISLACQAACSTQSNYDFCQSPRTLTFSDKTEARGISCYQFAEAGVAGFEKCDALTCSPEASIFDKAKCSQITNLGVCGQFNCIPDAAAKTCSKPADQDLVAKNAICNPLFDAANLNKCTTNPDCRISKDKTSCISKLSPAEP